jgi:hypothetical protein
MVFPIQKMKKGGGVWSRQLSADPDHRPQEEKAGKPVRSREIVPNRQLAIRQAVIYEMGQGKVSYFRAAMRLS